MSPFSILVLSLIVVPLCTQFYFRPFLPNVIENILICKVFFAVNFALLISLWTFRKGVILKTENKWLSILLFYVCMNWFLVPTYTAETRDHQLIIDLLRFLPLFYALIYYLFYLSLQNICRPLKRIEIIAKTLMWVGAISGIYLILQSLGLDDRQELNTAPNTLYTVGAQKFSFFGHPNFAGTFIALCAPFAIYFRKWLLLIIMCVAVAFSQSYVPCLALFCGLIFYLWNRISLGLKIVMVLIAIICSAVLFIGLENASFGLPNNSGRFQVWLNMWTDIKQAPLFGHGFGIFTILFNANHPIRVPWQAAHNEFWQFTYDCGFVGLFILLTAVGSLLVNAFININKSEILLAYTSTFAIILLCGLGQFVWQIEPVRYVTVVVISIISILTSKEAVK